MLINIFTTSCMNTQKINKKLGAEGVKKDKYFDRNLEMNYMKIMYFQKLNSTNCYQFLLVIDLK